MKVVKRVLCPQRLRRLPAHWSWVDHRLVRDEHISRCEVAALALYLLLVCVADAQGLSYYSDVTVCRLLKLEPAALQEARQQLQKVALIAFEKPIYQVLDLGAQLQPMAPRTSSQRFCLNGEEIPIREVIQRMLGGDR